jgi:hypothetical protein
MNKTYLRVVAELHQEDEILLRYVYGEHNLRILVVGCKVKQRRCGVLKMLGSNQSCAG